MKLKKNKIDGYRSDETKKRNGGRGRRRRRKRRRSGNLRGRPGASEDARRTVRPASNVAPRPDYGNIAGLI